MGKPRRGNLPPPPAPPPEETAQPWVAHLIELRNRLLYSLLAIGICFIPFAIFAREWFALLAGPLLAQMPSGGTMIATEVASPFLTPFKFAMVTAVVAAVPFWLHQVWCFVAPGLYKHEKRLAAPLLISSTLLFYLGVAFAYFVVFPLVFDFMNRFAPEGVAVMTDISRYLDFVMSLFLAFGLAFEVPVATVLLVLTGLTSTASLKQKRAYVFLGTFVLGMLLTPPDVISQTLLAVPMYLLFELGILFSGVMLKSVRQTGQEDA